MSCVYTYKGKKFQTLSDVSSELELLTLTEFEHTIGHTEMSDSLMEMTTVMSKNDIMKLIEKQGNPLTKSLMGMLEKHIPDGVIVKPGKGLNNNNPGRWSFDGQNHIIELYTKSTNLENVLVHELIHAATAKIIQAAKEKNITEAQENALGKLIDLYREFLFHIQQDRTYDNLDHSFQAEDSFDEFLTGIFTDKKLQNYMSRKVSTIEADAPVSILQRIINTIFELLGIKPGNLLSESMLQTFVVLDQFDSTEEATGWHAQANFLTSNLTKQLQSQITKEHGKRQVKEAKNVIKQSSRYYAKNDKFYIDRQNPKIELVRMSNWLETATGPSGESRYYAFNKKNYNEKDYEDNIEWGNQVDMILSLIIEGKKRGKIKKEILEYQRKLKDSAKIPEVIIDQSITHLSKWVQKQHDENTIILSQVTMGNADPEVEAAGTVDVVLIRDPNQQQDGPNKPLVDLVDLKTSIYTTIEEYQKIGKDGKEYTNSYWSGFKGKASKQERHKAQLSGYKGFFLSKGIEVGDTYVLAMRLEKDLSKITHEKTHKLNSIGSILRAMAYDSTFEGESAYAYGQDDAVITSLANKIRIAFQERLEELIRTNAPSNYLKYVRSIISNIDESDPWRTIETFVWETHNSIIGTKKFEGFYDLAIKDIRAIKDGNIKGEEAIAKLRFYRKLSDTYSGITVEAKELYEDIMDHNPTVDQDSTIDILNNIIVKLLSLENKVKKEVNPLLADILYSQIPAASKRNIKAGFEGVVKKLRERIDRKKKRLAELEKEGKKDTTFYKKQELLIADLEQEILNTKRRFIVDKEDILELLEKGGGEDISWADFNLSPGIMSNNPIIALFVKTMKEKFENNRISLWKLSRKAAQAYREYSKGNTLKDDYATFNKGLYEIITTSYREDGEVKYRERYALVSDINWTAYKKAEAEAWKKYWSMEEGEARNAFISKWFADNTEALPEERITITNPYTGDKVTVVQSFSDVVKEMKAILTDADYIKWERENVTNKLGYGPDTRRPRKSLYSNAAYEALKADPKKFKYHQFLLATQLKAKQRYPESTNEWEQYYIPTITKDVKEMALNPKDAKENLKVLGKQAFGGTLAEDIEQFGAKENIVPILYNYDMPLSSVSLNLLNAILALEGASMEYETRNEMLPTAHELLDAVEKNPPAERNSKGKPIFKRAAAALGISDITGYAKKHNDNYMAAMLEALIDQHIYGRFKQEQIAGGVDWGKAVDSLIRFSSLTQIGGNPILGVTNALRGAVETRIEAWAGEYYNNKDWLRAQAIYDSHLPLMMNDFASPVNKSKLGQLFDVYDAIQGEWVDAMGRKMTQSMTSKLVSTNSWYWFMHQGEHWVQGTSLIASLVSKKVKHKETGKEISLWDAYYVDANGDLAVKEGYDIDLVDSELRDRVHNINKSAHGVYNSFDRPLLKRHLVGRLLFMYRDFVVPGIRRRYQRAAADYELGNIREGFHRTFMRVLMNDTKELMKFLAPGVESNLTEHEKANLIRSLVETMWIMSTGATAMILGTMGQPNTEDPEKLKAYRRNNRRLYLAMRLNAELGFFGWFGDPRTGFLPDFKDPIRMFKSPVIAYGTMVKFMRVLGYLYPNIENGELQWERYERDAGFAKKGQLKLTVATLKLLGVRQLWMHPEVAIQTLNLQRL